MRQPGQQSASSNEAPVNRTASADSASLDVVARCQAGDVDAFAELYARYSSRIFTLAARMSGSQQTGEDLEAKQKSEPPPPREAAGE